MDNYHLINKGIEILHPLLAGYLAQELSREYRGNWWQEVLNTLSDQMQNLPDDHGDYAVLVDSLDLANCLRLFDRKWNEVFRGKLSIDYRTWSRELMGIRNRWAHIGGADFSDDDTWRALDTMARLCNAFDSEAAEEIRELIRTLQYRNAGQNISILEPSAETVSVNLSPALTSPLSNQQSTPVNRFSLLFQRRVDALLSQDDNNVFYVFKGFALPQIEYLIHHPNSVLDSDDIITNQALNLQAINEKWMDIFKRINESRATKVGFYEELLLIKDFLGRLKTNIVIVENNMLFPWTPCSIPYEQALKLFDNQQDEQEPNNEQLQLLTQLYGDVKLLEDGKALLLPLNLEGENEKIKVQHFWEETIPASTIIEAEAIEIGSQQDWEYRVNLLFGAEKPVQLFYSKTIPSVREKALASILSALGIEYGIHTMPVPRQIYDTKPFTALLKRYWGEDASFRPLVFYRDPDRSNEVETISQGEIIAEITAQCEKAQQNSDFSNIFITAPTGSGKSILFQLPALTLAEKYNLITIVVSPLIALMNDQVEQLNARGVSVAACIHSNMAIEERAHVTEQVNEGKISLLYLSPELLMTINLKAFLGGRNIGLFVIDEAHTVVGWGRGFRSDYWFLGDFLRKAKRDGFTFPVLCLTATAVYSGEDDVVHDTITELGLEKVIIHLGNVRRKNIFFDILCHKRDNSQAKLEDQKMALTLERMRKYIGKGEKTLAYFPYAKQVDDMDSLITPEERPKIRRYRGGIPSQERRMTGQAYKSGKAMGLICTKAFGMGVDVSDVIHVIHFAPSDSLADYIQEIGRAARNQDLKGYAHIDFFPGDLRYARVLSGLSEMRQYQLREMLKKLCDIYESKQRRNLLVSSDTFAYLFRAGDDADNRTKFGLMLLAKDLANKYSFPVLIVRPKAMLSKNYVSVPWGIEEQWLKKYGQYATLKSGNSNRIIPSRNLQRASDTTCIDLGNTYLVDMAAIWENCYPDKPFGTFKKEFFEEEFPSKDSTLRTSALSVSARLLVGIRYTEDFDVVRQKMERLLNAMVEIFRRHKNAEKKQFIQREFEEELAESLGEKMIAHENISLLLDIFSGSTDENASFSQERNQIRVLLKRKQVGSDETVYFVSNFSYDRLVSFFTRHLSQCQPSQGNNNFQRFYPRSKTDNRSIPVMPLLRLLELLNLARYEIRGGENAEIFVRINDPQKLHRLAYGKYTNAVLQAIHIRHKRNQNLLSAFFTKEMSDESRWDLIEQYFLGNEDYVNGILGIGD